MTGDLPIDALSRLLAATPELATTVNSAATAAAAAGILADTAAAHGILVDRERLTAHMDEAAARRRGALSDGELDRASGGGSGTPGGMVIGTTSGLPLVPQEFINLWW